jgi:beta-lactamase regulating signal transducer with metallopeptidase domain
MNTIDWLSSLDSFGFQVFRTLISVLWQSTILLGGIGLSTYFFKVKRDTSGYFLWAAAIIIIPAIPLLTQGLSLFGSPSAVISIMPAYSDPHTRIITSQLKQRSELKMRLPVESGSASVTTVNMNDRFIPLSVRTYMFSESLEDDPKIVRLSLTDYRWALLLIGYVLTASFLLFRELSGRIRIRGWINRGSVASDPRITGTFLNAKKRLGLAKKFRIIETGSVSAPMTTGIFHPVVILPEGFTENLTDHELEAVAFHELSHIKRNDVLIFSVIYPLRAVFFFFPLVWVAARRISYLAEVACDRMVIIHTGEKIVYAKFLTRLAGNLLKKRYTTGLSAGIIFSKSTFYSRIEALLSNTGKHARKMSRTAMAGLIAIVFISLLTALGFPLGDAQNESDMVSVSGRVIFEGGYVSGADIYFSEQWSCKAEKVARSGANGAFQFNIPRSKLVYPNRSMPALIAFKKQHSIGWVTVKNVWSVNGLTLLLGKPEKISGTVIGPDGAPVKGAVISMRGLSAPHFGDENQHDYNALYDRNILPGHDTKTDGSGRFVIENVPEGIDVELSCKRTGYAEIHRKNIPAGLKDMVVELKSGATIEGRLSYGETGKPARNIKVNIGRVNGVSDFIDFYTETKTDFRGNYRAENLPPGEYTVFLKDQLTDWTALAKTRVSVEEGTSIKDVDLTLIRGGFVTGRILDKNTNKPLTGHMIRYSDESYPAQRGFTFAHADIAYTDKNGFYCFRAAPGKVTISTTGAEGYEIFYLCKSLELSNNITIAYSDFRLKKAIAVTGKILNRDGSPAAGMQIKIPNTALLGGGYAGLDDYVITDFEGRFAINGLEDCKSFELKVYDSRGNFKNSLTFIVKPEDGSRFNEAYEHSRLPTKRDPQSIILSFL